LATALVASLVAAPVAGAQTDEAEGDFTVASIDSDQVTDRVGLVDPATGIWHIRGAGGAVNSFFYGNPGDFPIAGDWDCDGISTPGLYRQSDGFVYLRNSNSEGVADIRFFFGNPGDIPLAGDFNGDGCDTISIYRAPEARIYVINKLGANDGGLGAADFNYVFGNPGDKPFVGDFDGDGIDTVGLHRESTGFVYFRNSHTQGNANAEFFFGDPGDRLVAGDWGVVDNIDTPAIFRPSNTTFYFRHTNTQGNANETVTFGQSTFLPISGRWKVSDTPPPPTISGPIPPALTGSAYRATLTKSGGLNPLTVEKLSGPAWIKVSADGVVSGTAPGTPQTVNFGVRITDRRGQSSTANLVVQVVTGCQENLSLTANQCTALVNFFKATGGYGWLDMEGWFIGDPCTEPWEGITCTGSNVSAIELDTNNLTGSLPNLSPFIGLTILDFQDNAIGGSLANLTALSPTLNVLDLSNNRFGGSIPGALFGFPLLTILDLDHNNLGGSLPAFNLPSVLRLNLSTNRVGGQIPASIGNITTVQELHLSTNLFSGPVPPAIQNLTALAELSLSDNGCLTASGGLAAFLTSFDPDWSDGCVP
jgi:hypothetical protein